MHRFLITALLATSLLPSVAATAADVELVIESTPLHALDKRLFGQFLERPFASAEKGERGPEGYVDANGDLPEHIVTELAAMRIPVVRFPAGTTVDYSDWTYLIDRAPGRANEMRGPTRYRDTDIVATTRFGWHEYARLAKHLGWETIAAVNLLDGLAKRKPLAEAALHAAGLVAYLNAPVGAKLPEGMPNWPAIRAANGHPEPFNMRYIQLGNEWFMGEFKAAVKAAVGDLPPEQLGAWYAEVLRAHVLAIRAVDPKIEIIIDANGRAGGHFLPDPVLRKEVRYVAIHVYSPQATDKALTRKKVTVSTEDIAASDVSADEFWQSWTAMPGICDEAGQNQGFGAQRLALATSLGYRVAATEWNWASWGKVSDEAMSRQRRAAGIGAAQFIHGLFRQGDLIDIAVQSIVLGTGWNFSALKAAPDGQLIHSPQGQMTSFYNTHHGKSLLKSKLTGVTTTPGTLSIAWSFAQPAVAQIDALATGGDGRYIAHFVNRSMTAVPVTITTPSTATTATIHRLLPCATEAPDALSWFTTDSLTTPVSKGACRVEVPAAAVIAVEFAP
ncbi:MAG: hypothetical protein AAB263_13890 [Planctomycetota bacterium]